MSVSELPCQNHPGDSPLPIGDDAHPNALGYLETADHRSPEKDGSLVHMVVALIHEVAPVTARVPVKVMVAVKIEIGDCWRLVDFPKGQRRLRKRRPMRGAAFVGFSVDRNDRLVVFVHALNLT